MTDNKEAIQQNILIKNINHVNEHITTINNAYGLIIQLTDGEDDPELKQYYDQLLDDLQKVITHIQSIEKQNIRYTFEKAIEQGSI